MQSIASYLIDMLWIDTRHHHNYLLLLEFSEKGGILLFASHLMIAYHPVYHLVYHSLSHDVRIRDVRGSKNYI